MRTSLVLISVLAAVAAPAAAHPHAHLHNRHLGLVRRANETEEAVSTGSGDTSTPPPTTSSPVVETSTSVDVHPTSSTPAGHTSSTPTQNTDDDNAVPTSSSTRSTQARPTETDTSASQSQAPSSQSTADTETSTDAASTSAAPQSVSQADPSSVASTSAATAVTSAARNAVTSASTTEDDLTQVLTRTNSVGLKTIITTRSSKPSSTATAAASKDSNESSGLPKGALIAIIVIASIIGAAVIGFTLFRKWKLRPSNRFDARMKPIDFSPNNDRDMGDDFIEKTLQRSASVTSADRQRQQFVADLDHDGTHAHNNSLTAGIPDHDFTAGAAGAGTYHHNQYDPDPYEYDPYARSSPYDFSSPRADPHMDIHSDGHGAQQYEASNSGHGAQYDNTSGQYDNNSNSNGQYDYPAMPEPAHAMYPPQQPGAPAPTGGYQPASYSPDYPTQDFMNNSAVPGPPPMTDDHTGYSNLQRGPSVGHTGYVTHPAPFDPLGGQDFSIAGRPTGGADAGPYAQAAAFRY